MFKKLLGDEQNAINAVLGSNLVISWASNLVSKLEPWLHLLLTLGQIAVAGATVWYIVRRTRAIRVPQRRRRVKRKK